MLGDKSVVGRELCTLGACGFPYRYIAAITRAAPRVKMTVMVNWNKNTAAIQEMMMEREVANPFRMLSAYFTTTATMSPPTACCTMTATTRGL